jgi:hypothetical protein
MISLVNHTVARTLIEERARAEAQVRPSIARVHEAQRRRVRESLLLHPDPPSDSGRF